MNTTTRAQRLNAKYDKIWERSVQIKARQMKLFTRLRAQLAQAWKAACDAEGIPATCKFVEFGNTPEAVAYNKLALRYFNNPALKSLEVAR